MHRDAGCASLDVILSMHQTYNCVYALNGLAPEGLITNSARHLILDAWSLGEHWTADRRALPMQLNAFTITMMRYQVESTFAWLFSHIVHNLKVQLQATVMLFRSAMLR